MKFPETIPSKQAQWATMCPGRSPEFKVHASPGLANSAIANKKPFTEIALYELKADGVQYEARSRWTKVWEYVFPTICRCGNEFGNTSGSYGRNRYNLDPEHTGNVKDAEVICYECWDKKIRIKRDAQELERNRRELARAQAKISEIESRRIARLDLGDLTAKE